jgi:tRNA dimethylallyltransferase
LGKNEMPLENVIIVGITTDKDILISRIKSRIEQLFKDGVIDEAKLLGDIYGWNNEAMKSNVYPIIHSYLNENMSLDEVKVRLITLDWRLAKRQLTWLRRNRFIHWLSLDDARKYLSTELAFRK